MNVNYVMLILKYLVFIQLLFNHWHVTLCYIMSSRVLKSFANKSLRRYGTAAMEMPNSNFIPRKYKGPSFKETGIIKSKHIPAAMYNIYRKPLLLHQGYMQYLYDHEGTKYLDLFGGIVTVSVGHCHPKVVSALKDQANSVWHTTNIYRHPKLYEYVEKLVSKFPGDLKVVYLLNSGTEANDLALLLAKAYTGHHDVVSFQSSYHGYSTSVMGLTATQTYRMPLPVPPGFHHALLPDPFRGVFGGCRDSISQVNGSCVCPEDCKQTDKYIHQLSEILENSIPARRLAALFAESIQGVNGTVQFTKGYLKKAHNLVKKHGGLLVSDEVQSGFGRTGDHFWGFEGHGIIPDIVTMAKGIGNGFPLAAVVTRKEIADAHTKATYFNTFGGNPLACAVGKAVLEVIEEENLQQKCKELGKYFIDELISLKKQYPIIGDVRGKGLMLGVELVKPGTKEPITTEEMFDIMEDIKTHRILIGRGGRWNNVLRIKPPMCITKEDVDFTLSVLDQTFNAHKKHKN